jgi:hypothetical protein
MAKPGKRLTREEENLKRMLNTPPQPRTSEKFDELEDDEPASTEKINAPRAAAPA